MEKHHTRLKNILWTTPKYAVFAHFKLTMQDHCYVNYKQKERKQYKAEDNHLGTRNGYKQHSSWTRLLSKTSVEETDGGRTGERRGGADLQFQELFNYSMTWALKPKRNKQTGLWQWTNHADTHTCTWNRRETHTVLSLHALEAMHACLKQRLGRPNMHLKNHLLPWRAQCNLPRNCQMIPMIQ